MEALALAALAQSCLDVFQKWAPKQPNLGLYIKRSSPFISQELHSRLLALHAVTSGARHGQKHQQDLQLDGIVDSLELELKNMSTHSGVRLQKIEAVAPRLQNATDYLESRVRVLEHVDGCFFWQNGSVGVQSSVG